MMLSAIVQLALISAIAPPAGDTTYTIDADGRVVAADTVETVPDQPEIAKWPDKRIYRPGEEVLVAAHFQGGGYVVDHRVGDTSPVPEIIAWTDRQQYDVGDEATVYVQTGSVPGYVMVLQVDDDGTGHILFPRTPRDDNYLGANQTLALPGPDEPGTFTVTSATGTGLVYAVISTDHFDLSRLQDEGGWRSGAIRISASPSAAASAHWGRLFWQVSDVAKGVSAGSFNSHLLSYSVVNPKVARRRLFVQQTVRQCAESYMYYDPDLCPPYGMLPCVILKDGMVLFGDACAWYEFSLRYAADRAAWCAETHNSVSCAGLPPSDSGTRTAGVTPPAHHLGNPFAPKPISKSEVPPAWGHLASALHPAPKPPPAEPPAFATGALHPKAGAAPPHATDPGFAPPRTTAERPEPPRSNGGDDRSPQSKDRGSSGTPSSNGGGNTDAPRLNGGGGYEPQSGGGGGSYQPVSPSSGGGITGGADPSPQSQPPSYSPPDHQSAGSPPGSAPPPAPEKPPAD